MVRLVLVLIAVAACFVLITFIFNHFFKQNKYIKYIPSIITLAFAIFYYYLAQTSNQGFQDVARALMAVMLFTGFLAGVISGLIMDLIAKRQ